MKKLISLLIAGFMLTGCAQMQKLQNPLDNQKATKTEKTAQAAGFGALFGGVVGKMFGVDSRFTALVGGLVGGFAEWNHETDREMKVAQAEEARMKAAFIEAKATEVEIKVKDEKGEVHSTKVLGDYSVPATNDVAVKSVSNVVTESAFPGQIVIVANTSQRASIESGLQITVDAKAKGKKPVKVTFLDAKVYASKGVTPGISWVPTHNTQVADTGKKGGAA